jgi:hypothetical protein
MRIIDKIIINIVKNTYLQQVDGGLAECVTIVGKRFNSSGEFIFE